MDSKGLNASPAPSPFLLVAATPANDPSLCFTPSKAGYQCINKAIRIMIGIGTPKKNSNIERM
ncbi:hypothetical protein ENTCAN_07337 [Enterobacter cancerogenus ATCC 35316]|nr:hypothetical protein ENTCAN_07337 [Enterobacter cancerogenus ATCC 35316]